MYPPHVALTSLLLAAFVIALGYGLLLPVLPDLVARLADGASEAGVVWHTGLLTATYAGAALVVAPLLGRAADRSSDFRMIALALAITGLATIAGAFATSLSTLYIWRFVAGLGAGAVGPGTQAWLGRWASDDNTWRTRRVVWVSLASTAGLFIGPFAGGLAAALGLGSGAGPVLAQKLPFLAAGALLLAAAALAAITVRAAPAPRQQEIVAADLLRRIFPLLVPVAITALAIGAFEVALAFMANGQRMSPFEIGLLFAQCTLFMFAVQIFLILPRFRDRSLRPLIVPALSILAVGLTATTFATGTTAHLVSTALVAIGGGLLTPVLAREIAALDGGATGAANGIQTAVSQAGQTAGAAFASLVAMIGEPGWTFIAAMLAVLATGIFLIRAGRQRPAVTGASNS